MRRRDLLRGALAAAAGVGLAGATGNAAWGAAPQRHLIGRSVRDRPIFAFLMGPEDASEVYLALGQMHGDERAGVGVTRSKLLNMDPPKRVALWVIPTMNPDGHARDRRTNANGVDLNRNFPSRDWVRQGQGTRFYSGPEPMSEPETRVVKKFLDDLRPRTIVSIHQPLACVDYSGGTRSVTDWLAEALNLPARRLGSSGGNMTKWFNDKYDAKTAVTLELPPSTSETYRRRVAQVLIRHAASRR